MKRLMFVLLCIVHCALCINMEAQVKCEKGELPQYEMQHKNRAEWFAQMRAKKLVYLVDAMGLTETEKAAFSVLFEKYEQEIGLCHKTMRQARRSMSENPTAEEYENVVKIVRVEMLKMAQLRAEYFENLEKILPAVKIYKLYEAEESYKKLLIKDMGKCRQVQQK